MYDTTDWPRPMYEVTSYALYNVYGGFIVHDTLDDFFFHFGDSLREALEYADNGELSREALAVLATYPA